MSVKSLMQRFAVYPRVYGECSHTNYISSVRHGLSPRIRGMHIDKCARQYWLRFIPAYTGNAPCKTICPSAVTVYPRVYGECPMRSSNIPEARGLSPRIRGMHCRLECCPCAARFIPAYTGNALHASKKTRSPTVYPRVYGECSHSLFGIMPSIGLSPRIRGMR